MFKRIVLFLATNLAVLLVLSIVLRLLGVDRILDESGSGLNYEALLIMSAVIGFGGSFISLALSKWMAKRATGARVIIRMLVEASEADWPLSRKFGCSRREALRLMDLGRFLGLDVAGISFHPGSQVREPAMWASALDAAHALWTEAADAGHPLRILNIGGGFPAFYGLPLPATEDYAAQVMRMVRHRFGEDVEVMAEPGPQLTGVAGQPVEPLPAPLQRRRQGP